MAPEISVVVPTFRRPRELHLALASALGQQGVTVEVLVVDDSPEGSARATVQALRDRRVRYLRTRKPTGGRPGQVRNEGWPLATGRFVHFLDDDDLVPPGHYAAALRDFERFPEAGVVFGRVEPFAEDDRPLEHERNFFANAARRALVGERLGQRVLAARQLLEQTMLVCSAGVSRIEVVRALGGFDPAIRLVEDVDYYARAFRNFGAHFTDRVVLHYRIGHSLMHSRVDDAVIVQSYRRMHQKYRYAHGPVELVALKALVRAGLKLT